jgi:hypothetical protein
MPQPSAPQTTALLTVESVRALKADYEADMRLLQELPARVEFKKRRLEAAMLFLPPGIDLDQQEPAADKPPDVGQVEPYKPSWTGEMARILSEQDGGLAHKDLLQAIRETEFGKHAHPGDKGFYNAVGRLAEKGLLVKAGGLLYHRDVANRILARGESLPDLTIELNRRAGSAGSLVVEVLSAHPKGLTAPELKKLVAAREDAPKSLQEHGQYIYNVLSTLIGNGSVVRKNGIYRLTKKA